MAIRCICRKTMMAKVIDVKGEMDGTKNALEDAVKGADDVKEILIETPLGMDDTQIRVTMTNADTEDKPQPPKDVRDLLDEWGYQKDGESTHSWVYRSEKTIAKYEA